jgi:hypothetical protein
MMMMMMMMIIIIIITAILNIITEMTSVQDLESSAW